MAIKKTQIDILDDLLCGPSCQKEETIPDFEKLFHWAQPFSQTDNGTIRKDDSPIPYNKKQKGRSSLLAEFITNNKEMLAITQRVEVIAKTKEPVLITGESGVGKELIVKTLHQSSELTGRLVAVDTAAIDDNIFSDTLFGHCKGAFPGANRARKGLIDQASGGTLFLDEIGILSPSSQLKLLRLLQEGTFMPLGQDKPKEMNARVVTTTNHDLWRLQREGLFRQDLNYRLRTHHIHIPPLRERMDDLPLLLDHFLTEAATALNKAKPLLPNGLIPLLNSYSFPGNIRELRQIAFDAVSRQNGKTLSLSAVKAHLANKKENRGALEVTSSDIHALRDIKGVESLAYMGITPTKKKTTYFISQVTLERLNNVKERTNKLLPAELKLQISQSQIVDFALRLVLAEFETKKKESLLIKRALASKAEE